MKEPTNNWTSWLLGQKSETGEENVKSSSLCKRVNHRDIMITGLIWEVDENLMVRHQIMHCIGQIIPAQDFWPTFVWSLIIGVASRSGHKKIDLDFQKLDKDVLWSETMQAIQACHSVADFDCPIIVQLTWAASLSPRRADSESEEPRTTSYILSEEGGGVRQSEEALDRVRSLIFREFRKNLKMQLEAV